MEFPIKVAEMESVVEVGWKEFEEVVVVVEYELGGEGYEAELELGLFF